MTENVLVMLLLSFMGRYELDQNRPATAGVFLVIAGAMFIVEMVSSVNK